MCNLDIDWQTCVIGDALDGSTTGSKCFWAAGNKVLKESVSWIGGRAELSAGGWPLDADTAVSGGIDLILGTAAAITWGCCLFLRYSSMGNGGLKTDEYFVLLQKNASQRPTSFSKKSKSG